VTPSTTFSRTAWSAATGVRSSWLTLATSSRRGAVDLLEVLGHAVEGARGLADLVPARGGDAPTVVAAGHRPGRRRQLAQRRGHPVGEQLGHPERQQHGHGQRVAGPPAEHDQAVPGREGGRRARGDDQQTELDLDRPEPVERPEVAHAPVSNA
jgi:hypothetical protein